MTPEERIELSRFLQLMQEAQSGPKDAAAEAMINEAFARKPDAAYLLVQRVMQLEHAARESQHAWGRRPEPTPAVAAPMQPQSAWGSGLLGTVASTAAGVVAGSFLAQGIGSLFGNHAQAADTTPVPPGGGTLVETDYGAHSAASGHDSFDSGFDSGDGGGDFG